MIRLRNEQGAMLLDVLDGHPSMREVRDLIRDQLQNPRHDEDLVSLIANALFQQHSSISGNYLMTLREAVLNPREIAKAKAMADSWQSCIRCGRAVLDGEMTTVCGRSLYCVTCKMPTLLMCDGDHRLAFPDGVNRVLQKSIKSCGRCAHKPQPLEETPLTAPLDWTLERFGSSAAMSATGGQSLDVETVNDIQARPIRYRVSTLTTGVPIDPRVDDHRVISAAERPTDDPR